MSGHLAASFALTVLILLVLGHLTIGNSRAIELTARPVMGFAPQDIRIQLRVHRNPANRQIRVAAVSDNFERVSQWDVEGERAPVIYELTYRDVPAGDLDITAEVADTTHVLARDSAHVTLLGR